MAEAAAHLAHHGMGEVVDHVADLARVHHLGGEDKERHRNDDEGRVEVREHLLRHDRRVDARGHEIEDRGGQHSQGNRDAQDENSGKTEDEDQEGQIKRHGGSLG
jgi:hypothetical protein